MNKSGKTSSENLNVAQREAVQTLEGPLLVLAGAGAGKTKVIVERILNLVRSGVPASKVLAITFTNKAAKEMRERVFKTLSQENFNRPDYRSLLQEKGPFVSTFHSLGVFILRENAELFSLPRHFAIFDRADSRRMIRNALKTLGLDPKRFEPEKMVSIISRSKGDGRSLADIKSRIPKNDAEKTIVSVWNEYELALQREKALDFDDLLLKTVELLSKEKKILEKYRQKWSHVHVDEYQDTNKVQYALVRLLVDKKNNICVVGDVDQTIYSWRGSNLKNLLNFEKDFPNAKVVLLEENYRSTKTIIAVSNEIISKNIERPKKNLFTNNPDGEKISLFSAYDEEEEARFVANRAKELIKLGVSPEEIAVLYRANFQSRALEEAFIDAEVPYEVLGIKFFARKEVKDILSYIRVSLNPHSSLELARIINVPRRGIGQVTLEKILAGKEKELNAGMQKKLSEFNNLLSQIKDSALSSPPSETVRFVMKSSGIEEMLKNEGDEGKERLENLAELVSLSRKYDDLPAGEAIEKLLEDATLATDQDSLIKPAQAVKLLTVHASKGLEFDYCFITGLEENLFPHRRWGEGAISKDEEEEERRIFYVALTRARKKVFLTLASVRTIFGSKQINLPSEFIIDINDSFIHMENESSEGFEGKTVYLE